MLTITIPPAPESFEPDFPPQPELPYPSQCLSPRHLEQYNEWDVAEREVESCDPDVQVFIAQRLATIKERDAWKARREMARLTQWPGHFYNHLPASLRALVIAAPMHAALLSHPTNIDHVGNPERTASIAIDHANALINECSKLLEDPS